VNADPLDCLHQVMAATASGAPVPPEAAAWLRFGLHRYLHQGEPLETALRLGTTTRLIARNRALCDAAQALDPDGALGAWDLAEQLRAAIIRFESRILPRLQSGTAREISPHEACLLRAFQAGAPRMLRSRRRLWDLLTDA
jgi:hypothetical protein